MLDWGAVAEGGNLGANSVTDIAGHRALDPLVCRAGQTAIDPRTLDVAAGHARSELQEKPMNVTTRLAWWTRGPSSACCEVSLDRP